MAIEISSFTAEYNDYLRDESRLIGKADSISFPKTEEEIKDILIFMNRSHTPVTIQGARTGIVAGACPNGGHVLNLSGMKRITGLREDKEEGVFFLTTQPGVSLVQIRRALATREFDTAGWSQESLSCLEALREAGEWFFPPDPTETSASIGGMVACNASGARSYFYGSMRNYVEALRIILADGSSVCLRRGEYKAEGRSFLLEMGCGKTLAGMLPGYVMPAVKNAAGYYVKENMDLIDLLIGCEGTLGVISEVELRLLRAPKFQYGVMAFFPSEEEGIQFVRALRETRGRRVSANDSVKTVAIEYFNHNALMFLNQYRQIASFAKFAEISPQFHTAIYVEFHSDSERHAEEVLMQTADMITANGGNEDDVWLAMNPHDMERLKNFRHAVPEAVNMVINERKKEYPNLTKLSTDMAVPDSELENVLGMYNRELGEAQLEAIMFGHIGDNHIHVNILPKNMEEYQRGKHLYSEWAGKIVRMGGTISAEHGVGKLKKHLLMEMYGKEAIAQMYHIKKLFDPVAILNRGDIFDSETEHS